VSSTSPSEAQFDALREVANVGCGHAANALSKLVGGRSVRIDVPRAVLTSAAEIAQLLGGPAAPVVATSLEILGQLRGCLLFVLQQPEAHRLSLELLSSPKQSPADAELRALEEAGNIVACACLNAIAAFTGLRLLPSTPTVTRNTAEEIAREAIRELKPEADTVMVLETRFSTSSPPLLSGQLLVLPRGESVQVLFDKLGV
jgi:chemotaxis protein CheC